MKSHTLPWIQITIFLTLLCVSHSSPQNPPTQISYSDHCAKLVPEATPLPEGYTYVSSLPAKAYFRGGDGLLNQNSSPYSQNSENSFEFRRWVVSRTATEGVFKVETSLFFRVERTFHYVRNFTNGRRFRSGDRVAYRRHSITIGLNGFWSESSGKLCMVGSGNEYPNAGKVFDISSVLKLSNLKNSTSTVASLVSGTLESLKDDTDPSHFEQVSILMFPHNNYNFTLVSESFFDDFSWGKNHQPGLPLSSVSPRGLCSLFSGGFFGFNLRYNIGCDSENPKNCTPFGESVGYLPTTMSMRLHHCVKNENRLQLFLEFHNTSFGVPVSLFDPTMTLVGEGSWDEKRNQLFVSACRISNATHSWDNAHIEDCSIRLSLKYSSVLSIREDKSVVGEMWSNKSVSRSGYFSKIKFHIYANIMVGLPGLKYEFTEVERARESCAKKNPSKSTGKKFPRANSYDMRFDMSVSSSKGKIARGFSTPFSVGDRFYEIHNSLPIYRSNLTTLAPVANISYKISIRMLSDVKLSGGISSLNMSLEQNKRLKLSAEGVYDAKTGALCMVGCRTLGSNYQNQTNDSLDCEILVNFQFSPLNGRSSRGDIKGSIESTRKKSDSLYFERLDLSSNAHYVSIEKKSIWRMDMEIIMVLISYTLACVFAGLQLFYVKKHPDSLPYISLVMLVVLTLGYMMPLLLNFEAMFLKTHSRRDILVVSGGWLEVNEVIVRVVTMVAFLLQIRLLQLSWSARMSDENQKSLWIAEKKTIYASLPLYILGALLALLMNWRNKNTPHVATMLPSSTVLYEYQQQHSIWMDLKSYSGLVLDGFLLPQILANMFNNSKERSLSLPFYVGTTFVRMLPHAYDLYRAHIYAHHFDGSYIYANPSADFYSTVWDVVISLGGLVLALVIYLQQRFGARCFLPRRFREAQGYEKVPVVSET